MVEFPFVGDLLLASLRDLFESERVNLITSTRAALCQIAQELNADGLPKTEYITMETVEAELHHFDLQLEKILVGILARVEQKSRKKLLVNTRDLLAAARSLESEHHTILTHKLQEASDRLKQRYRVEWAFLEERLAALKEQYGFREVMAKREPVEFHPDEQSKGKEVTALVTKHIEKESTMAREIQELANTSEKRAACALEQAAEKTRFAADAKRDFNELCKEEIELGRKQQQKEIFSMGITKLARCACEMVKNGNIDINALAEIAAKGKHVWAWQETKGRMTNHPVAVQIKGLKGAFSGAAILYEQKVWSKIEAYHHAYLAGGGDQYLLVPIHVGPETLCQPAQYNYTVNVKKMLQINNQTGYQRKICRLHVETPLGDSQLLVKATAQRVKALQDPPEKASSEAVGASWEAAFELRRSICLQQWAQQWTKKSITTSNPFYPNGESVGLEGISMGWTGMGWFRENGVFYAEWPLYGDQAEHKQVREYFFKSEGAKKYTIKSIKRIQNVFLWHLYDQERERVSQSPLNKGNPNEEFLWHGASRVQGALEKILVGGFDEQYSKFTPKGTWLSSNALYSADTYCIADSKKVKRILLVRCVLGYIGTIEGKSQLAKVNGTEVDSHHCGGTSVGHIRLDDQTGGADNRYVINRNNQLYPAYVVEFY